MLERGQKMLNIEDMKLKYDNEIKKYRRRVFIVKKALVDNVDFTDRKKNSLNRRISKLKEIIKGYQELQKPISVGLIL
jgi:predicted  nucleic acid-binding Zn-ribbon protein